MPLTEKLTKFKLSALPQSANGYQYTTAHPMVINILLLILWLSIYYCSSYGYQYTTAHPMVINILLLILCNEHAPA